MWRDRTNLYISYRQSYSHHPAKRPQHGILGPYGDSGASGIVPEERRGLMSAGAYEDDGDAVIEMDLLPPRWMDVQDEVTEMLQDIASQTRKLEQLHQKHVLPGFDDEDVKKREEREIERVTQAITRQFHGCQKAIQRIDKMVKESRETGGVSKGEEAMARNLKVSLAGRVGDASALFRKKQSAYLKKLRSMGGFASPIPSSTPIPNAYATDPSLMESETDRSFSQSTLMQAHQSRMHNPNETAIAQREREIEDIAQGIIELANIFQELQTMVIDQGSMLDRIDYNVERMAVDVKAADKELTVATGYQKRSVKRKVLLLLIILVAGMFILLGLKLSSKSSPPAPAPVAPPAVEQPPQFVRKSDTEAVALGLRRNWRRRKRRLWD
ncbi:t-SNARE [Trichodelitschia bisporula]|uniref:t-SNARE n=1 Tax=Trichodelitschia bisporula TaxID=703511 RepID=A0A6G1HYH6_9PEZI|nr:t-SNARE [Trichodelitschia bisporula]